MFRKKKIYVSLIFVLAVSFVIAFSATNSFAQRTGEEQYVSLKRNERKNSYTTVMENNVIYFQAEDVEDPLTKKLLEGKKKLQYRCTEGGALILKNLGFSKGNSKREKVECLAIIKPRIILDESQ